jgi:hypothetical protein
MYLDDTEPGRASNFASACDEVEMLMRGKQFIRLVRGRHTELVYNSVELARDF